MGSFKIRKGAPTRPAAFSFTPITGATPSTAQTSNTVTLSDFVGALPISVSGSGGMYSKNGGGLTSASGFVVPGDTISLGVTSSAASSTDSPVTFSAGLTSATWHVTTQAAAGVVVLGPDAAWTPATGFGGTRPADSDYTRTTGKPAGGLRTAWNQRIFSNSQVIGVDADADGGISKVEVCLGGPTWTDMGPPILYTDTDVNSVVRKQYGWFVEFDQTSIIAVSGASTGAIDMYYRVTPADGTMQQRVLGPYRFFPRPKEFDKLYEIRADGVATLSGEPDFVGCYTTLDAALHHARGNGWEAAEFRSTQGGDVIVTDSADACFKDTKGFYALTASVPTTWKKTGFATWNGDVNGSDPTLNNLPWRAQVQGLEVRGANCTVDMRYFSQIGGYAYPYTGSDGVMRFNRLNGCTVINSAGRDSWDYVGTPRPAGVFFAGTGFCEDVLFSDVAGPTQVCPVVERVRVLRSTGDLILGCIHVDQAMFSDLSADFMNNLHQAGTLKYTGAGSGSISLRPVDPSHLYLVLKVNGSDVATIQLGYNNSQINIDRVTVGALINAVASWTWVTTGPSDSIPYKWNIPQEPLSALAIGSTPVEIDSFWDLSHDDLFQFSNAVTATNIGFENFLHRRLAVRGEAQYASSGGAFGMRSFNMDHDMKDYVCTDSFISRTYGGVQANDHIVQRNVTRALSGGSGEIFGTQFSVSQHSRYEQCTWLFGVRGGSPSSSDLAGQPIYKDNLIVITSGVSSPATINTGANTGNVQVNGQPGEYLQAQFADPDNGDGRAASTSLLKSNLKAKVGEYDITYTQRSSTDWIGAFSANSPGLDWSWAD